jgi:preprotein translocase subunit SecE
MEKITEYIKEVIAEAKHVTWPTRKQTMFFTIAVLAISIIVAYYLGALDFLFSQGLKALLFRF